MRAITDTEMDMIEKPVIECRDVRKVFCSYLEGDLTETLAMRVGEHIAVCPVCKEFDSSYREVISLAKEIGESEKQRPMPKGASKRLRESLNERLGISLRVE